MTPFRKFVSFSIVAASVISGVVPAAKVSAQEQRARLPNIVNKSTDALLKSVISRTPPVYPAWAGYPDKSTVVVKVVIGQDGSAISAALVSGDHLLGWSAIEGLRHWRWQPTQLAGLPARVVGLLSFTFAPDGSVSDGSAEAATANRSSGPQDADLLSPDTIALFKEGSEESRLFEQAPEIAIRVNDSNEQPLFVEQARIRGVRTAQAPQNGTATSNVLIDDHSMRAILVLRNTTQKRITKAELRFTNWQSHTTFLVWAWSAEDDPPDRFAKIISHMAVPGDPSELQVEAVSAKFADGTVWKSDRPAPSGPSRYVGTPHPIPQEPLPGGIRPPAIPVDLTAIKVDSRPKPLNSPRPNYTEKARRNGVAGTARLMVFIGDDGSVKRVEVITPLPDFLTEEAIKAVYQIKFKPAFRDGEPVAIWQVVEIDFNLR